MGWISSLAGAVGRALAAPTPDENVRLVEAYEALEQRERYMIGRLADNAYGIKQRPVEAQTRWQPYHRDRMREECEQGNFRTLARFIDFMHSDGEVTGITDARTAGMLHRPEIFKGDPFLVDLLRGREPTVNPATGQVIDPGKPGLWKRMAPSTQFAAVLWDAIHAGLGLGEMVKDHTGIPVLRHLDLHWLRYEFDLERFIYQSPGGGGPYEVRPGDGRWVMCTPKGARRFWLRGAWYPLAYPVISKAGTALDALRWQGQLADPLKVIKSGKSSSEPQRKNLLRFILEKWHRAAGLVTKEDELAYLVESNGRGYEIYEQSDARADRAILFTLAGQTVTGDGNKGFNSLEGFDAIRADLNQDTADAAAECAVRDIIAPWALRFWGVRAEDAPSVGWDVRSSAQRAAEVDAVGALVETLEKADPVLERMGLEVDITAAFADHGLRLPTRARRARSVPIALAPTDLAKVVRVVEARKVSA